MMNAPYTVADYLVDRLAADGGPDRFRPIVGETLSTYASITKIMWILGRTRDWEEISRLFYKPVANDILYRG